MKATQSFAQDRDTGTTPAAGAKAGAIQGTFTTSAAIPWKPVDPKKPDGVQMFVVWGNPNKGASEILLKFPAGMDVHRGVSRSRDPGQAYTYFQGSSTTDRRAGVRVVSTC